MNQTRSLRVFTNYTDYIAAYDLDDLQAVWEEHNGCTFADEMMTIEDWDEVPSDETITVRDDDNQTSTTKTAAAWAAATGRGLICSTEY